MITGVGLITTSTTGRGSNVMAAEWTMLVSKSPPMIMVVIRKTDATNEMIRESGEFGVSIAAEEQADAVSLAGSFTGHETDKFSSTVVEVYPAKAIRAPMIRGAAMNAECKLRQSVDLGEYTGFIGEVVEARYDPEKRPLAYQAGRLWKIQEIERPPILYVTGTYDPIKNSVRAEGRMRPTGAVELVLSEANSDRRRGAPAHPDQWGFYAHEWEVRGVDGGYTIEAEGAGLKARANIGQKKVE
jgi:flavin reductase (DIM6/NTAB) family NADH-FMN oxidoreductase RutF